jgi:hypothetical protein
MLLLFSPWAKHSSAGMKVYTLFPVTWKKEKKVVTPLTFFHFHWQFFFTFFHFYSIFSLLSFTFIPEQQYCYEWCCFLFIQLNRKSWVTLDKNISGLPWFPPWFNKTLSSFSKQISLSVTIAIIDKKPWPWHASSQLLWLNLKFDYSNCQLE